MSVVTITIRVSEADHRKLLKAKGNRTWTDMLYDGATVMPDATDTV